MPPLSIGRAALAAGLASASVAVLGLGREMLVSRLFGASAALDAYLLAMVVATMGSSIISLSLHSSIVPVLAKAPSQRERNGILSWALLGAAALGVGLWLASLVTLPWLLHQMIPEADPRTVLRLTHWLSPLWCTGLLAGAVHGALQADKQFFGSGLAPGMVPLGTVLVLLLGGLATGALDDVHLLAAGTLAGAMLEVAAAVALLWSRGWRWRLGGLETATRQGLGRLFRQTWAMAPGMAAVASAQIVDRTMAAMLGPGAVSVLNYGSKLPTLAISLGGMAVATAIFPFYAERLGRGETAGALALCQRWARRLLWSGAAVSGIGVALSLPVARLVFEGGAMTGPETVLVAQVQACAMLQMPLSWATWAYSRYLAASGRNGVLSLLAVGNVLVNVAGNALLMHWLGVPGIALATALVYAYSLLACRRAVLAGQ
ncbi:murein biosynthesis integral membrane protein MurJ [Megalodesulfovibrio paquesii]